MLIMMLILTSENFEKISANNSSKLVLNMLKIINDRADKNYFYSNIKLNKVLD